MRKVGLKAFCFTLICAMIFVGSAFANNATDHVSVAPNGEGDVLIFPAYFTGSGWTSKIIVTNTSLTDSVVAKVVIRSKERSQELRDFMIFLSPADVWTGTLMTGTDGRPHIFSTDDSCLYSSSAFASSTTPFDVDLQDACAGDTNELGYVTIIQGASFNIAPNKPGVSKPDILAAYNAWAANANTPINSLAGQMEINNSIAQVSYALNATTLKNYDYNVATQMNIQNETKLGESANNTIGEVEAALAKDAIVVPYYAQTKGSVFAIASFPTKLAGYPCGTERTSWLNQFAGFPSPVYALSAYDLEENTVVPASQFVSPQPQGSVNSFPSEVNYLSVSDLPGTFDEGWMSISSAGVAAYVTNTATLSGAPFTYTGYPVISSSMRFNNEGHAGWLYNAHKLGDVDLDANGAVNSNEEFNYHFWGQIDN